MDGTSLGDQQYEVSIDHGGEDPSVPYGGVIFWTYLRVPDGAAPQDLTVTLSDDSGSMEMVVPGMTARHGFASSGGAFPLDHESVNPVTPRQVIHLTHEPQLGWRSEAQASLGGTDLKAAATSAGDEMEITLPDVLEDKRYLFYLMKSFPTVSRCAGAASCAAELYTFDTQPISAAP